MKRPSLNINSGTFGQISSKSGSRSMSGQVRLEFEHPAAA
jgi:uncharacterized protein (DUF2345 family)